MGRWPRRGSAAAVPSATTRTDAGALTMNLFPTKDLPDRGRREARPAPTIVWAVKDAAAQRTDEQRVVNLCESADDTLLLIHLVHCAAGSDAASGLSAHQRQTIDTLKSRVQRLRWRGVDASLQIIRGVVASPAALIVAAARDVTAELIVLSPAHGHFARHHGPSKTTAAVIHDAGCPVLVLNGQPLPDPGARAPLSTRR